MPALPGCQDGRARSRSRRSIAILGGGRSHAVCFLSVGEVTGLLSRASEPSISCGPAFPRLHPLLSRRPPRGDHGHRQCVPDRRRPDRRSLPRESLLWLLPRDVRHVHVRAALPRPQERLPPLAAHRRRAAALHIRDPRRRIPPAPRSRRVHLLQGPRRRRRRAVRHQLLGQRHEDRRLRRADQHRRRHAHLPVLHHLRPLVENRRRPVRHLGRRHDLRGLHVLHRVHAPHQHAPQRPAPHALHHLHPQHHARAQPHRDLDDRVQDLEPAAAHEGSVRRHGRARARRRRPAPRDAHHHRERRDVHRRRRHLLRHLPRLQQRPIRRLRLRRADHRDRVQPDYHPRGTGPQHRDHQHAAAGVVRPLAQHAYGQERARRRRGRQPALCARRRPQHGVHRHGHGRQPHARGGQVWRGQVRDCERGRGCGRRCCAWRVGVAVVVYLGWSGVCGL